jgi:hypothetical protein
MNRRSLLTLVPLLVSLATLPRPAEARQAPKSTGLFAHLVGPRAAGGRVDLVRGPSGSLTAQVWNLPTTEVRLVLGTGTYDLVMDPATHGGSLRLDSRAVQGLGLRAGTGVAVKNKADGRVLMKSELAPR